MSLMTMCKRCGSDWCDGYCPAPEGSPDATLEARRGRLFKLRLQKNCRARQEALDTVHQLSNGRWVGIVGGLTRGRAVESRRRAAVEREINEHYNLAMMAYVRRLREMR